MKLSLRAWSALCLPLTVGHLHARVRRMFERAAAGRERGSGRRLIHDARNVWNARSRVRVRDGGELAGVWLYGRERRRLYHLLRRNDGLRGRRSVGTLRRHRLSFGSEGPNRPPPQSQHRRGHVRRSVRPLLRLVRRQPRGARRRPRKRAPYPTWRAHAGREPDAARESVPRAHDRAWRRVGDRHFPSMPPRPRLPSTTRITPPLLAIRGPPRRCGASRRARASRRLTRPARSRSSTQSPALWG